MKYSTNLVKKIYIKFTARIFFLFFSKLSFTLFESLYIYIFTILSWQRNFYWISYLLWFLFNLDKLSVTKCRDLLKTSLLLQIERSFSINIHFPIYCCIQIMDALISLASKAFNNSFISTNAFRSRNWDVPCDRHYLFTSPFRQIGNRREEERKKKKSPATGVWRRERRPFVCRIVHIYRS